MAGCPDAAALARLAAQRVGPRLGLPLCGLLPLDATALSIAAPADEALPESLIDARRNWTTACAGWTKKLRGAAWWTDRGRAGEPALTLVPCRLGDTVRALWLVGGLEQGVDDERCARLVEIGTLLAAGLERLSLRARLATDHGALAPLLALNQDPMYVVEPSQPIAITASAWEQVESLWQTGSVRAGNASLAALLGLAGPAELEGRPLHGGDGHDGLLGLTALRQLVLGGYRIEHRDWQHIGPDGQVRHYQWRDQGVVEDGHLVRVWGVATDVTARHRAEEARAVSEANLMAFMATVDDLLLVLSPDGRFLFTNAAVERRLGYTAADLASMQVLDLHPPALRTEAQRIFIDMLQGHRSICPLPLISKSGRWVPVETRVWLGRWSGAECVFGVCKDLSSEQEASQRFERLFRNNPAPMALTDAETRTFHDVNDAFLRTLGYERHEVVGQTSDALGLFPRPEQRSAAAQALRTDGRVAGLEMQVLTKDGRLLRGLFSGETVSSQGRDFFLTVMVDLSTHRPLEVAATDPDDDPAAELARLRRQCAALAEALADAGSAPSLSELAEQLRGLAHTTRHRA